MHAASNHPSRIILIPLCASAIAAVACSFNPGPQQSPIQPTDESASQRVGEPTNTSTLQPSFTPTQAPTPTPTPSPTPTPVPAVRLANAARATHNGDYASAMTEYQSVLSGSTVPDDIEAAQFGLGEASLRQGDWVAAENALTQFINAYPKSRRLADAWFLLGDTRYASGNPTGAIDAYREYLKLRGEVVESYVQERMGDADGQAGDSTAAIEAYRRAILLAPNTSIAAAQREKLASVFRLSGDFAGAIEQYRAILSFAQVDTYRAHVLRLLGQTLIDSGDASGYDVFLDLVNGQPRTDDAYQALVALVSNGIAVDPYQRGLVDYYAGQYDAAVAAFDTAVKAKVSLADARYYAAMSYRAAGNTSAAIKQFDTLINSYPDSQFWGQARIDKAIAQANAGDLNSAVSTLTKFAADHPTAALAPNALLRAGLLLERAGEYRRAAEMYRQMQASYPFDDAAPDALFASGLDAYRALDSDAAIRAWRVLSDTYPSSDTYPAALMWYGKLALNRGQDQQGRSLLDRAAQAAPFTYYGIRAAELRDHLPTLDAVPFDLDQKSDQAEAEAWLAKWTGRGGEIGAAIQVIRQDERFRRGAELWRLGWAEHAKDEFESLRAADQDDPIALYALSLYWRDIGLYRSSIMAAARVIALSPAKTTGEAPAFIARLAYPVYYADLIVPEAKAYHLDPLVLFALVRQESLFEGIATSSAYANGLMQVIPTTGREIAQSLGWPNYATGDLYKPYVSIAFGTYYLARQRDALDGDRYAALAAYNGGPGNAARWRESAGGDPDLFLETITLNETRTYLLRVREHLRMYQRLYPAH